MRYFLKDFEEAYNKEWPFGFFPKWKYYPKTGTHIGTDFKVVIGTPIFAPAVGEMFKTEFNQYKGNVGVYIFKHKGIEWGLELCHLRKQPQKGMYNEGEIIAYSGNTGGSSTGAHLHAVLHRDAKVTKHYRELQSRENFLRLEKEGAIVDCLEWFRITVQGKPKPRSKTLEDKDLEEQKKGDKIEGKITQSANPRWHSTWRGRITIVIIIGLILLVIWLVFVN